MKQDTNVFKQNGERFAACGAGCADCFKVDRQHGLMYGPYKYQDGTYAMTWGAASERDGFCAYCKAEVDTYLHRVHTGQPRRYSSGMRVPEEAYAAGLKDVITMMLNIARRDPAALDAWREADDKTLTQAGRQFWMHRANLICWDDDHPALPHLAAHYGNAAGENPVQTTRDALRDKWGHTSDFHPVYYTTSARGTHDSHIATMMARMMKDAIETILTVAPKPVAQTA